MDTQKVILENERNRVICWHQKSSGCRKMLREIKNKMLALPDFKKLMLMSPDAEMLASSRKRH